VAAGTRAPAHPCTICARCAPPPAPGTLTVVRGGGGWGSGTQATLAEYNELPNLTEMWREMPLAEKERFGRLAAKAYAGRSPQQQQKQRQGRGGRGTLPVSQRRTGPRPATPPSASSSDDDGEEEEEEREEDKNDGEDHEDDKSHDGAAHDMDTAAATAVGVVVPARLPWSSTMQAWLGPAPLDTAAVALPPSLGSEAIFSSAFLQAHAGPRGAGRGPRASHRGS
jgi:hypothetical protein